MGPRTAQLTRLHEVSTTRPVWEIACDENLVLTLRLGAVANISPAHDDLSDKLYFINWGPEEDNSVKIERRGNEVSLTQSAFSKGSRRQTPTVEIFVPHNLKRTNLLLGCMSTTTSVTPSSGATLVFCESGAKAHITSGDCFANLNGLSNVAFNLRPIDMDASGNPMSPAPSLFLIANAGKHKISGQFSAALVRADRRATVDNFATGKRMNFYHPQGCRSPAFLHQNGNVGTVDTFGLSYENLHKMSRNMLDLFNKHVGQKGLANGD